MLLIHFSKRLSMRDINHFTSKIEQPHLPQWALSNHIFHNEHWATTSSTMSISNHIFHNEHWVTLSSTMSIEQPHLPHEHWATTSSTMSIEQPHLPQWALSNHIYSTVKKWATTFSPVSYHTYTNKLPHTTSSSMSYHTSTNKIPHLH